jgi:hypothetical protein
MMTERRRRSWPSEQVIRSALKTCDEIVLFGSRSMHAARRGSDWDVLCIGERSPRFLRQGCRRTGMQAKSLRLDVVWISKDDVLSPLWLGSELAGHIARYGKWLKGEGAWRTHVVLSIAAIAAKRRRIEIRVELCERYAGRLLDAYRAKHQTLLRRDLQRLFYLENQEAVPVTPQLDSDWMEARHRQEIYRLGRSFRAELQRRPALFDFLDPDQEDVEQP